MQMEAFRRRYGPWALVAGGSSGLGAEFARQLARRGLNLILLAEAAHPLEELATQLANEQRVNVHSVVLDLARPDLLEELSSLEEEIGLVVCNAAHSPIGPFLGLPLASKLQVVDVNCRAPLLLAHHFGRLMAARGRGGLLLMSSMAGLQGSALVATYAASKAFNLVLAEGLWQELGPLGVDVLAVCPGPTATPGYEASQPRRTRLAPVMAVDSVVSEALAHLGRGPTLVAGRWNRTTSFVLSRLLPRRLAVRVIGRGILASYPRFAPRAGAPR